MLFGRLGLERESEDQRAVNNCNRYCFYNELLLTRKRHGPLHRFISLSISQFMHEILEPWQRVRASMRAVDDNAFCVIELANWKTAVGKIWKVCYSTSYPNLWV